MRVTEKKRIRDLDKEKENERAMIELILLDFDNVILLIDHNVF